MPESGFSSLAGSSDTQLLEPVPLRKGQRLAATAIGTALTGSGVASVFLGENQFGSGVLLLAGAVFLLVAVSGMPILGARFQEFELRMGWRWRQSALQVATRLPNDEAQRLLEIVDAANPGAYPDPLLSLIDSLLFEGRVKDATIAAVRESERIESHPAADIGEPLVTWVSREGDTRIGAFAMFAPTETGKVSKTFSDQFLRQLPKTGCDAFIMVTCGKDGGDLAALATRVRQDVGLRVIIEEWEPSGGDRSLRPAIDRLTADGGIAAASLPKPSGGDEAEPTQ